MARTICCALLALLAASGTAFPQRFLHPHFGQQHILVRVRPFYAWCPPWLAQPYYTPLPFQYPVPYGAAYPFINYTLPTPNYVYLGTASSTYPQLVFQDATSYTVADYWRVDDQLHFITVEDGGTKFVPHTVPFGDLDIDRTKDRAKAQGFRFVIRDKPIEQWLEERAEDGASRHENDYKR